MKVIVYTITYKKFKTFYLLKWKVFYFYIKIKTKIMKSILNFIDTWGVRIMFFLVIIIFFKTCTTNSKIQYVNNSVDSLSVKLRKEIKIEGLKSEKRTIQASDRKILDVTRQTQIDQEISKLDK